MTAAPGGGAVKAARAAGFVAAVLAVLVLGALSRVPWPAREETGALVRLSWRARSEAVMDCRRLSEAEQAGLPAHMRQDSVCERRAIPLGLRVRVDGRAVLEETLRGAGARGDRPLYVFREIPVAAAPHRIEVELRRLIEGAPAVRLDQTVRLAAGEIALVTLDDQSRLVVRR